MADFSQLSKLQVSENTTAVYTLYQIEGAPELTCAPATPDNKAFFNEALKKSRGNKTAPKAITADFVEKNRETDRKAIAKHVIKSWTNVRDSKGEEVEFNAENVTAFLEALPNWIFDEFREWASRPENFLEDSGEQDTKNS